MIKATAPQAEKRPFEMHHHGQTRVDNYYWLREKTNPEVIAYLEAENEYTKGVTEKDEPFVAQLYQEMVGRIQETDSSAPVERKGFYYYSRTVEGLQYPIYCRKVGSMEAEEQIILDLNELAKTVDYLKLGAFAISPNNQLLVYGVDIDGSEEFTTFFKDLGNGVLLADQIPNCAYSAVWLEDNQTILYTTQDEAKRSDKVWQHTIGQPITDDVELFHEPEPLYRIGLSKSRDHQYIFLNDTGIETNQIFYMKADGSDDAFTLFEPRKANVQYYLDYGNGQLYMMSNEGAKNFRLSRRPFPIVEAAGDWEEVISHREAVKIDDFDLFANHLVVYERENGLKTMRVIEFATEKVHQVVFPEPVYSYSAGSNPNFDSSTVRLSYVSLTTPYSDYEYDLNEHSWTLIKQQPVLGGYTPDNYVAERIFATAEDGTEVPISLVYRKGFEKNGAAPALLYGYGSYGYSIDPTFSSIRLSLLDRGFVFAIAHIRGGEDMGRYWYDQGKFLNKKNTFTDFIACARHLIGEKYTQPKKLAMMGGSAGGLLMGAVLNMAPELFHAAVAKVPFVDVVTTMLDETIPLTVNEYDEWGNPNDPIYYEYMLSYSPYDHVAAKEYPNILVTAGLNDPRVQYWEPAKWVAKLRELKTDQNLLLLKTNMGAGHGGASGRYDYLKEVAFDYAFVIKQVGE